MTIPTFRPHQIDAVLWDYDGTLVATRAADEQAVAQLLLDEPGAAGGAEVFWATEGQPIVHRIELAWPGRVAELLPRFQSSTPPRRFPGVPALVRTLHQRGIRQAVVSSRQRFGLLWGVEVTGLLPYLDVVISVDDVRRPKPDPEGLRLALRQMGVKPERAVYIGDNEVDVDAGHRAGVMVWRCAWAAPPEPGAHADPSLLVHPRNVLQRLDDAARSEAV